jgi:hypothetical protein
MNRIYADLEDWVQHRVAAPGEDLMRSARSSASKSMGARFSHAERLGYVAQVMFGGLDTIGGMIP